MKRILFLLAVACAGVQSLSAAVVRVGANEKIKSVAALVSDLRAMRRTGAIDRDDSVTVLFAPGDYAIPRRLELNESDGGVSASRPVIWKAQTPGTVRLTAARVMRADEFRPVADEAIRARLQPGVRDRVVCADLSASVRPELAPPRESLFHHTTMPGPYLFIDGRFATRARWPNAGWATFTNSVDCGEKFRWGPGPQGRPGAFVCEEDRPANWKADDVWMYGFWTCDWYGAYVRMRSYGTEGTTSRVVRLDSTVEYGVGARTWDGLPKYPRRYYFYNVPEELDAPGEWYFDYSTKRLYVMPPEGGPAAWREIAFASENAPLLSGTVSNIRFEGLDFAMGVKGAFALKGDGIVFEDCAFRLFSGDGNTLDGMRNAVRRCRFARIAGRCLTLWGGSRKTLRRADTVVENCTFEDIGLLQMTSSEAVFVNGCGMTVRSCLIRNLPHSAILIRGNEHLIERCEICSVLRESADAGAIYTGHDFASQGTVIRHNCLHDIGVGRPEAVYGVYLDDVDCGDRVEENVFVNMETGLLLAGGRDNPVRNNIFAKCKVGLAIDCYRGFGRRFVDAATGLPDLTRVRQAGLDPTDGVWRVAYPHLAGQVMGDQTGAPLYDPVEHNVFFDCGKPIKVRADPRFETFRGRLHFADNLALVTAGDAGKVSLEPYPETVGRGFRVKTLADAGGDFGFLDPERGDFTLKPLAWLSREMPAFLPVNTHRAGVGTDGLKR